MGVTGALVKASGKAFQEAISNSGAIVNSVKKAESVVTPAFTKDVAGKLNFSSIGSETITDSLKKKALNGYGPTKKVRKAVMTPSSARSKVRKLTPISGSKPMTGVKDHRYSGEDVSSMYDSVDNVGSGVYDALKEAKRVKPPPHEKTAVESAQEGAENLAQALEADYQALEPEEIRKIAFSAGVQFKDGLRTEASKLTRLQSGAKLRANSIVRRKAIPAGEEAAGTTEGAAEAVKEGKGLVDLAKEHPHVSTAVGALTLGGIVLGMTSNKGQRSNAQLYGSPY